MEIQEQRNVSIYKNYLEQGQKNTLKIVIIVNKQVIIVYSLKNLFPEVVF